MEDARWKIEATPEDHGSCPNLLDLIPHGGDWSEEDEKLDDGYGVSEEGKLELRLGLPGPEEEPSSTLSLGLRVSLSTSRGRAAAKPVVGWPPVRSFRKKKLACGSPKSKEGCRKPTLVKVNMDGIPIGRKIDLEAHRSYDQLASAVGELFRGLLAAQDRDHGDPRKASSVLLDGKGDYALVYEDDERDVLLVGDVPWEMFVAAAKRLRVMKSAELSSSLSLAGVAGKRRTAAAAVR